MGEVRNAYKILVGKRGRKETLGRLRRRLKDNIKIDFKVMDLLGVDWIHLAVERAQWRGLVDMVMKLLFL
jgi:hypothetical protein